MRVYDINNNLKVSEMKILDCTLRDGGYYTNWDFSKDLVKNYLECFNQLPVNYLEIGYRSKKLNGYLGEYFYCPVMVLEEMRNLTSKKLVIILNEKDIRKEDLDDLLKPIIGLIDMVRIAIDPANFKRALGLAEKVKSFGFKVGFNVMYMSNWATEKEFIQLIPECKGITDYFYMVDSFGGVYPEDVVNTINLVRSKTDVKLGFHGHNNLELGLINTLTALDHGVEMVDATVTGMGRGAGNLKLELLLTVLNAKGILDFDFNSLSKLVDKFTILQDEYKWGTSLPYMVSGANSLPQKNVMEWVSKRFYSFNSIIRALANQSRGLDDNEKLPTIDFSSTKKYKSALIVGGGPSAVIHSKAIESFIKSQPEMVIIHSSSRNAMCFSEVLNDQIFCLVGNEGYRMEDVFGDVSKIDGICILPPFPRKMGTYIPEKLRDKSYELGKVTISENLKDTHTAIALETVIALGIKELYIVGYDGYSGKSKGAKEEEVFAENEQLFKNAKLNGLSCVSITSTLYKSLDQESVFSSIM